MASDLAAHPIRRCSRGGATNRILSVHNVQLFFLSEAHPSQFRAPCHPHFLLFSSNFGVGLLRTPLTTGGWIVCISKPDDILRLAFLGIYTGLKAWFIAPFPGLFGLSSRGVRCSDTPRAGPPAIFFFSRLRIADAQPLSGSSRQTRQGGMTAVKVGVMASRK